MTRDELLHERDTWRNRVESWTALSKDANQRPEVRAAASHLVPFAKLRIRECNNVFESGTLVERILFLDQGLSLIDKAAGKKPGLMRPVVVMFHPVVRFCRWDLRCSKVRKARHNRRIRDLIAGKASYYKKLLALVEEQAESDIIADLPGKVGAGETDRRHCDLICNPPRRIVFRGHAYYRTRMQLLEDADLTDLQREAMELAFSYQMTQNTAAQFLGISRSSFSERVEAAKAKMQYFSPRRSRPGNAD